MSTEVFCPVDGLPAPERVRKGKAHEYKLLRLRECPTQYGPYDQPERIVEFWRANIETAQWFQVEQECFCTIYLSTRRHIIGWNLCSMGTGDTLLIHPSQVFRTAIVAGASAIIVGHNHPSGDATPSEADIRVTRDLIRAGQLLKLDVLDSIIVGKVGVPACPRGYVSLREIGYFNF